MKYAFYTGCAAKGATPELYVSTLLVAERLGIELVELRSAACCGAGVITEADPELAVALNARTFAMAEAEGLDIMTICGTCQGVMSQMNKQLTDDPGLLKRINLFLEKEGLHYSGKVKVKHFLWILLDDIGMELLKEKVTTPLKKLQIAPFYGCYILRPSSALGYDDPNNPSSLETVIEALGGEAVEYEGRNKCCGFPVILENPGLGLAMTGKRLGEAKSAHADVMVTPCPLCHMNLDLQQERAEKHLSQSFDMPVLHLPQLVGLAMGFSPVAMQMMRHFIPLDSLVAKLK
ncbi:MAG: CoB--CoM heterodisulfide reductase iron-sulfur subunit B family protein [Nitrospirae bacterium]|nr:CoB--CoM heterodisulfide reductase iron-sulfur subunit B family protein [Nitrospirota bacterium]MBI3594310.1 CoB--CoM heterodisulfide reductase iron-sulfur subunit B family protein [Nitrospirota bacterium]